jgi:hypothetical protein
MKIKVQLVMHICTRYGMLVVRPRWNRRNREEKQRKGVGEDYPSSFVPDLASFLLLLPHVPSLFQVQTTIEVWVHRVVDESSDLCVA